MTFPTFFAIYIMSFSKHCVVTTQHLWHFYSYGQYNVSGSVWFVHYCILLAYLQAILTAHSLSDAFKVTPDVHSADLQGQIFAFLIFSYTISIALGVILLAGRLFVHHFELDGSQTFKAFICRLFIYWV